MTYIWHVFWNLSLGPEHSSNGTLIKRKWIVGVVEGPWIQAPSRSPVWTLSLGTGPCSRLQHPVWNKNHFFSNMASSFVWSHLPTVPDLDFGLWAHGGQRFSTLNHVTSGPQSPRSFFPASQRFRTPNHVTFGSLSPWSFFPPGLRFSLPNHVSSGSPEPAILFSTRSTVFPSKSRDFRWPWRDFRFRWRHFWSPHFQSHCARNPTWSAVSPPPPVAMTTSRPIRSHLSCQVGVPYYSHENFMKNSFSVFWLQDRHCSEMTNWKVAYKFPSSAAKLFHRRLSTSSVLNKISLN